MHARYTCTPRFVEERFKGWRDDSGITVHHIPILLEYIEKHNIYSVCQVKVFTEKNKLLTTAKIIHLLIYTSIY